MSKIEQVFINPNQSEKVWQNLCEGLCLRVKTDSHQNLKNLEIREPTFLSCLKKNKGKKNKKNKGKISCLKKKIKVSV